MLDTFQLLRTNVLIMLCWDILTENDSIIVGRYSWTTLLYDINHHVVRLKVKTNTYLQMNSIL